MADHYFLQTIKENGKNIHLAKTYLQPDISQVPSEHRYFQMHPKNNIVFNLTPTKPDLKDKVLCPSVTLFTRQYKILFKMLFFTITMHVN